MVGGHGRDVLITERTISNALVPFKITSSRSEIETGSAIERMRQSEEVEVRDSRRWAVTWSGERPVGARACGRFDRKVFSTKSVTGGMSCSLLAYLED